MRWVNFRTLSLLDWMIIVLIILGLLACFDKYSNPRATSVNVSYTSPNVQVENLFVARDSRGMNSTDGSMLKIRDGCRVIYVLNGYYTTTGKIIGYGKELRLSVSDAECRK